MIDQASFGFLPKWLHVEPPQSPSWANLHGAAHPAGALAPLDESSSADRGQWLIAVPVRSRREARLTALPQVGCRVIGRTCTWG
jgi:hypothetical protein